MFGWLGTLRLIPVIGGLFFSPFKAHIEAFKVFFSDIVFIGFPNIIPMIGATFQPFFSSSRLSEINLSEKGSYSSMRARL